MHVSGWLTFVCVCVCVCVILTSLGKYVLAVLELNSILVVWDNQKSAI